MEVIGVAIDDELMRCECLAGLGISARRVSFALLRCA